MRTAAVALAACLMAFSAFAREGGLPVGSFAPPLNGSTWISADGKAPNMKNKVILMDFWFAG